jgi:hypothetical protein
MTNLSQKKYEFTEIHKHKYATISYNEEFAILICKADSEYIPINDFKKIFSFLYEFTETSNVHCFVFDKTNLRTFHQPSMEWYYTIWKSRVKVNGLVNHYKILPKLEWFSKAVAAGKHEIFHKYGEGILEGINVFYINSIEELITQFENDKNGEGNNIV